jgi:hypothetical protein
MVIRRGAPKDEDLVVALIAYAGICTLALVLWPGASGRYAMPATFAIAAGAGLAYDRFLAQRGQLVSGAVAVACALVVYRLVLNWIVMPLDSEVFRKQAILGHQVAAIVQPSATLLVSNQAGLYNLLAHVPQTSRVVPPRVITQAPPPFWAIVMPDQMQELQNIHPAGSVEPRFAGPSDNPWRLVEVRGKP